MICPKTPDAITLYLAGPNGTGKTTFYSTAVDQGFIPGELPFVNIDLIAKNELGGYSNENFKRAEELYRARVGAFISEKKDFMIESNLAYQSDYDWLHAMLRQGFEAILYFLYTERIEINIGRVQKRVKEGGHDVAVAIIQQRYQNGLLYLKSQLHLFSEAYLIDNSFKEPFQMAVIQKGDIIFNITIALDG
ncbi:MAG: hypothetical protein WDO19_32845 [Bacteroidota bacterium]